MLASSGLWLRSALVCLVCAVPAGLGQQRLPPGVNPTHYQQQPAGQQHVPQPHLNQQQFQQQPGGQAQQQFQQPQQFQQQHPGGQGQQQFQQPQPVGQGQQQFQQQPDGQAPQQFQPVSGHANAHAQVPQHQQQVLHRDVTHEKEHMREHMDVPIDTSNMSEQELQFHYFKMHDADGNNKLDGCELVKSLIHWHDHSNHDQNSGAPLPEEKIFKDEELINMIDPILATDDKNQDGFIDYPEFIQAQQAAQARINAASQ